MGTTGVAIVAVVSFAIGFLWGYSLATNPRKDIRKLQFVTKRKRKHP